MSYISVSNMSYKKSVWWLYTVISSPCKVDFLDITFNLKNGTYRPYKKPNDLLSDINKSSNHPPQFINQLLKTINERSSRNSSNEEVFNSSKHQCEKALRESGYTDFELKFNKTSTNQKKDIGSVTLFDLIRLSAEQSPQILEKFFPNYTSPLPTLQQASKSI